MTWIKIVPFADDPALSKARKMQQELYPAGPAIRRFRRRAAKASSRRTA